jgi:hypothetical protein
VPNSDLTIGSSDRVPASLKLIVRPMSTGAHRAIELLVGFSLVGYSAYGIWSGRIAGKLRVFNRGENPWSFWMTVLFTLCIGFVFLLGNVSWRD